jgi:activator of HSP90 ATPase
LKGTLGSTVINFVSTAQPSILSTMLKVMNNDKKKGKNTRALEQKTTYAELVTTASHSQYTEPGTTSSGGSGSSSSGSSGSGSSVPVTRRATLLKNAAKNEKINIIALLILFMPALLYYVVDK